MAFSVDRHGVAMAREHVARHFFGAKGDPEIGLARMLAGYPLNPARQRFRPLAELGMNAAQPLFVQKRTRPIRLMSQPILLLSSYL